jgi:hypothetical protein
VPNGFCGTRPHIETLPARTLVLAANLAVGESQFARIASDSPALGAPLPVPLGLIWKERPPRVPKPR